MRPALSFLIPTFDGAAHIKAALESILHQVDELPNALYEIVICINGSTDETATILSEYEYIESLTIVSFETNLGYDKNILRAIEETKGDFIWFLGDDDILLPESVKFVLSIITSNTDMSVLILEPQFFSKNEDLKFLIGCPSNELFIDGESFLRRAGWNGSALSSLIVKRPIDIAEFMNTTEEGSNWIHLSFLFSNVLLPNPREVEIFAFISKGTVAVRVLNPRWAANFGNYVVVGIRHLEVLRSLLAKKAPNIYRIFYDLRRKTNWSDVKTGYTNQGTSLHWKFMKSQISLFWREPNFWLIVFPILVSPEFLRRYIIKVQEYTYIHLKKILTHRLPGTGINIG